MKTKASYDDLVNQENEAVYSDVVQHNVAIRKMLSMSLKNYIFNQKLSNPPMISCTIRISRC